MSPYSARDAMIDEQRELTRLCVRAAMQTGYGIHRSSDAKTYSHCALIAGAAFRRLNGDPAKSWASACFKHYVALWRFVDSAQSKRGWMLRGAAATQAKALKRGLRSMIYAERRPKASRSGLGAAGIGEGHSATHQKFVLPHALHFLPRRRSRCEAVNCPRISSASGPLIGRARRGGSREVLARPVSNVLDA
jgi:hypothetical protein